LNDEVFLTGNNDEFQNNNKYLFILTRKS